MHCDRCNSAIRGTFTQTQSTTSISPDELQKLLRSPEPSSPIHTAEIPRIIAGIDADIYRYETQIRRLHSEITALENKRCRAKAQQSRYKSLLAPVRRLPNETLDYIFRIYGEENPNVIEESGTFLPGLTLMAVCSRFRVIALSCSGLWTNISIVVDGIHDADDIVRCENLIMPLKWCLDHAGLLSPFNISFAGERFDNDTHVDIEVAIMLASVARRWRHVSFSTERSLANFPSFEKALSEDLPLLESLELQNVGERCPGSDLALFQKVGKKLSKVSLRLGSSDTEDLGKPKDYFPCTQVKDLSFHFGYCVHDSILGFLAPCTTLESLSYEFLPNSPRDAPFPSQSSNTVTFLKINIHLAYSQPDTFGEFLNSASFPALKKLSVIFDHSTHEKTLGVGTSWPEKQFNDFFTRSNSFSLIFLELKDVIISDDALMSLLWHAPYLVHLTLHQSIPLKVYREGKVPRAPKSLTMEFIRRLHASSREDDVFASSPAVPKLQHLDLRVLSSWFNDDQLFVDVIRSRWMPDLDSTTTEIGVECLKSVRLKVLGRSLNEMVYQPLIQLDGQGMQVELFGDPPK